jgi:hypothetical protein|tara:strand:- start:1683 stop:2144 length:462 start_codon:yes stop_codon:yes gene_type:complete
MSIIKIDGVSIEVEAPDLDNDGIVGGVEKITQKFSDSVTNVIQPTELEGSLKELNADIINPDTRMSAIDMRTRLHPIEISAVLAIDSLVALGVLPQKCLPLSTQKKRLNVSELGKGRQEMVELVAGKRESDVKMGAIARMQEGVKGFFGGGGG